MTELNPSKPSRIRILFATCLWMLAGLVLVAGCLNRSEKEVVVFVALDREFSQPILSDLEQEMGIKVRAKFDQESNKTVGLVTGIINSKQHPQADIFWNNEILHTLRLQELGLLEVYLSPQAEHFPNQFLSRENQWHGFSRERN